MKVFLDFSSEELCDEIVRALDITDEASRTRLARELATYRLHEDYKCTLFNRNGVGSMTTQFRKNTLRVTNHDNGRIFLFALGEILLSDKQEILFAVAGVRIIRKRHSFCLIRPNHDFLIGISHTQRPQKRRMRLTFKDTHIKENWSLKKTVDVWRLEPHYPGDFAISQVLLTLEINEIYDLVQDFLPMRNLVGLVCENLINQSNLLHWRGQNTRG